jgi:hypothetical protein
MHRAYRQKVRLFLDLPSEAEGRGGSGVGVGGDEGGGDDAGGGGDRRLTIVVNATIFLPISEGAFVDADDPLLARYIESGDIAMGAYCEMSVLAGDYSETTTTTMTNNATTTLAYYSSSTCDIEFVHPEVIDIEQPSFASRQHVVAYRVGGYALIDPPPHPPRRRQHGNGAPSSPSSTRGGGGDRTLEIVIEYGTTLHVRYPAPIVASSASGGGPASPARNDDDDGLVSVVVQQPILYSAYASLNDDVGSDDVGSDDESTGGRLLASYALRTDDVGDDRTTTTTATTTTTTRTTTASYPPPDPIVIRVAAGVDSDYLFVTVVTMMSALIGGLLVIRSLDSISVWC